jgi:hypothetical protein
MRGRYEVTELPLELFEEMVGEAQARLGAYVE